MVVSKLYPLANAHLDAAQSGDLPPEAVEMLRLTAQRLDAVTMATVQDVSHPGFQLMLKGVQVHTSNEVLSERIQAIFLSQVSFQPPKFLVQMT